MSSATRILEALVSGAVPAAPGEGLARGPVTKAQAECKSTDGAVAEALTSALAASATATEPPLSRPASLSPRPPRCPDMRRSPRPRSTPTSAGRRRAPDCGRGVERGARMQAMRGRETHPASHSPSQFFSLTFSLSSRLPPRTQGGAGTGTAFREVAAVLLTGLERRPGRRRIHYDGCRRCTRRHVVRTEVTERMGPRLPLVPRRHAAGVLGLGRSIARRDRFSAGPERGGKLRLPVADRQHIACVPTPFRACNPRVDALRLQRRSKSG